MKITKESYEQFLRLRESLEERIGEIVNIKYGKPRHFEVDWEDLLVTVTTWCGCSAVEVENFEILEEWFFDDVETIRAKMKAEEEEKRRKAKEAEEEEKRQKALRLAALERAEYTRLRAKFGEQ